jgi:hypothetical protein
MVRTLVIFYLWIIFTTGNLFSQNKKDFVFDAKNSTINEVLIELKDKNFFTPDESEIKIAKKQEICYLDSLEKINKKKLFSHNRRQYFRQYLGYIDNNGDKVILINAFCERNSSKEELTKIWKNVLDGGECYYQIEVNLNTKKCFKFSINGDA